MQSEPEDGSPYPYTDEQLRVLAQHLKLPIDHNDIRFVVGIGRQYLEQRDHPPHLVVSKHREQRRRDREVAAEAENAIRTMLRLYSRSNLRGVLSGVPGGVQLTQLYRDETLTNIANSLAFKAAETEPPAKRGQKSHDHITVALMSLLSVWEWTTERKRVSRRFLEDALHPLGCPTGKSLDAKITEAKRLLNPRQN